MSIYQYAMLTLATFTAIIIPVVTLGHRYGRRLTKLEAQQDAAAERQDKHEADTDARIKRIEADMNSRPDKSDIVELRGAINTLAEGVNGVTKVVEAQGKQLGRIHDFLMNDRGVK
jgi:phage repressor protein C with HTH and peptisase S24 domain